MSFLSSGILVVSDEKMANQALRYNEGKPKYSYIDLESFADTAKVNEFGQLKYARDNWKLGLCCSILDSTLATYLSNSEENF